MKRATVYSRQKKIFVQASSRTVDGIWVASGPVSYLGDSCSDEELGSCVVCVVNGSVDGISPVREWNSLILPVLRAADVKSWAKFVRGTVSVEIEMSCDLVSVILMENLGASGGFEPIPEVAPLKALACNAEQVGAEVRRGIHQAR